LSKIHLPLFRKHLLWEVWFKNLSSSYQSDPNPHMQITPWKRISRRNALSKSLKLLQEWCRYTWAKLCQGADLWRLSIAECSRTLQRLVTEFQSYHAVKKGLNLDLQTMWNRWIMMLYYIWNCCALARRAMVIDDADLISIIKIGLQWPWFFRIWLQKHLMQRAAAAGFH